MSDDRKPTEMKIPADKQQLASTALTSVTIEDNRRKDPRHALMMLCHELFTTNLIGTDFDDVQVLPVEKRSFLQQPDGKGLHVCFSVSWHTIGKLGEDAHKALRTFEPADGWD